MNDLRRNYAKGQGDREQELLLEERLSLLQPLEAGYITHLEGAYKAAGNKIRILETEARYDRERRIELQKDRDQNRALNIDMHGEVFELHKRLTRCKRGCGIALAALIIHAIALLGLIVG